MVNTMHIIKFVDSLPLTWATPEFLLCEAAWGRAKGIRGRGQEEFDTTQYLNSKMR